MTAGVKKRRMDSSLFSVVSVLVLVGFVMIYSSSGVRAGADKHIQDDLFYMKKQALWGMLGFVVLFITSNINYKFWKKPLIQFMVICGTLCLLVAVLIPGVGRTINGSTRWLALGGFTIQPSELAKIAIVIYLAGFIERRGKGIRNFKNGFVPVVIVVGVFLCLILKEPDLGTVIFLALLSGMLLFLAGSRMTHLLGMVSVGVCGAGAVIWKYPYMQARIASVLDPWNTATPNGYQLKQSMLAFASGSLLGAGLGKGRQKLFFLPELHTDFIFAMIGEEIGFLGCLMVIVLFLAIFTRGMFIAADIKEPFGRFLAYGLTFMIVLHVILNMGVVTGILPTTGLPLPFLSYGGSSLLVNLASVGILLNVSKHRTARRDSS